MYLLDSKHPLSTQNTQIATPSPFGLIFLLYYRIYNAIDCEHRGGLGFRSSITTAHQQSRKMKNILIIALVAATSVALARPGHPVTPHHGPHHGPKIERPGKPAPHHPHAKPHAPKPGPHGHHDKHPGPKPGARPHGPAHHHHR